MRESDPWYVVSGLRAAHRHGGILVPVGNGEARMQVSYAGNVAWARLCTLWYTCDHWYTTTTIQLLQLPLLLPVTIGASVTIGANVHYAVSVLLNAISDILRFALLAHWARSKLFAILTFCKSYLLTYLLTFLGSPVCGALSGC